MQCIEDLGGVGNPNTVTSQEAEERSPLESGLDVDTTIFYIRDGIRTADTTPASRVLAAPALLLVLAAAWSRLPEPSRQPATQAFPYRLPRWNPHRRILPVCSDRSAPTHPPSPPLPCTCTAPTPPLRSPDTTRVIVPVPRPTAYRRRDREDASHAAVWCGQAGHRISVPTAPPTQRGRSSCLAGGHLGHTTRPGGRAHLHVEMIIIDSNFLTIKFNGRTLFLLIFKLILITNHK